MTEDYQDQYFSEKEELMLSLTEAPTTSLSVI